MMYLLLFLILSTLSIDISRSTSEKKEEAADLASIQWHDATIPVPSLKITILVVGTRGDIQPFLAIGHKLKGMDHSVRLATHRDYEDLVKAAGLKFFPLGGDPKKLSSFMVETSGFRLVYGSPRNMAFFSS